MTAIKGKVWKFGDDINTDVIMPFKIKSRTNDPYELASHCMSGLDPDFPKKVSKGDFIVAGKNFGCGSSREQAPIAIKYCGIAAVIAESFARILYRNAISIGLPVLQCEGISDAVEEGDTLEVDAEEGIVTVKSGKTFTSTKLSGFLNDLIREGGVVNYYKKYRKFPWE